MFVSDRSLVRMCFIYVFQLTENSWGRIELMGNGRSLLIVNIQAHEQWAWV